MAKEKLNASVEPNVLKQVSDMAAKENRNFSNMVEVLLDEALLARIIKSTKKKK